MREITITSNDAGRRLDRFLRKYLPGASLGEIYKIIRKDVKVDSKRRSESYMLSEGETLTLYLSDETLERFGAGGSGAAGAASRNGAESFARAPRRAKRTFGIIYEDENVLMANKPYGLLTHGDSREKKDHLANQVKDYLIASGAYDPRGEKVFVPAPANRLDRNTTGIVLFGKTAASMRELNRMIREDEVRKFYLTIACGVIDKELHLGGSLVKDERKNKVTILNEDASADLSGTIDGEPADKGGNAVAAGGAAGAAGTAASAPDGAKTIGTIVRPLQHLTFGDGLEATLCEVELVTGRSHQIRAHLASIGHPLAGDSKYADMAAGVAGSQNAAASVAGSQNTAAGVAGSQNTAAGAAIAKRINRYMRERFGLTTQLLHACRVEFPGSATESETLGYLAGKSFDAPLPARTAEILKGLGAK